MIEPAALTFTRTDSGDVGIRQVFVSIDGRSAAVLLHGQSATVEVPAGEHRLRIHNTLVWKTIPVSLAPGEQATFSIVNRAGFGTVALVATLGVGPLYLTVERREPAR